MKRICSIYKSPRKNEMYLYVLQAFDLVLTPERKLAREDIAKVLENLDNQGYHLQMPPVEDEYIEHLPEELLRRNDPV